MKLYVMSGSFKKGRVEIGDELILHTDSGVEHMPAKAIVRISKIASEGGISGRLSMAAGGGIIGGIAAGIMAGGLTGPAGAVIGAVAGAALASGKILIYRVEFADGRHFIASGSSAAWDTLRAMT